MKRRLSAFAVLLTLLMASSVVVAGPAAAAPPNSGAAVTVPVTGTFTDPLGGTGTFTGTLTITSFAVQNGQLVAVGTLTGTLTDSLGNVIGTVTRAVTLPVAATGTCQILHLELGPIDLDLLGLQVHLDKIVLDIEAQAGPGNLLGNLLCTVARLLDTNAALAAIANLLNQILALL